MTRDHEKAKARKLRYRERKKVEKYGPQAAGKDLRGRHCQHPRGAKHHRWNAGRMLSEHGYVKIRVGEDHPLADPNGYAYEHLLVWVSAGHPLPGNDELLHHRDETKTNNQLSNLQLIKRVDHSALHILSRKRDNAGRLLDGIEHSGMPAHG